MNKNNLISDISLALHHFSFRLKSRSEFDVGSLIVSIDVDVGSVEIEQNSQTIEPRINKSIPPNAVGRMEENNVPLLLRSFDRFDFPATFAIRGQLTEVENSIINQILDSSVRHDIGGHGYTHRSFTSLSTADAESELKMLSAGLNKFGITPRSFVFPKNHISHLHLLEKHGYLCFRGLGSSFKDGLYIKKHGQLFDVHPSLFIGRLNEFSFSKKLVDLAVKLKSPLHLWFHPWNFGTTKEIAERRISKVLEPLVSHAYEKKRQGLLGFETMCSIAEKYQKMVADSN